MLDGFFVTLATGFLRSALVSCFFVTSFFDLKFFEELSSDEESDGVELDDATSVLVVSVKDFREAGTRPSSLECEEDSSDLSLESLSSEGGSGVLAAVLKLLFCFLIVPSSDSDEVEDDSLSDSMSDAELDVASSEPSDSEEDSGDFEAWLLAAIFAFFALGFSSSESDSDSEFEDEDEELGLALRFVPAGSFEDGIEGSSPSSSSASLSELVEEENDEFSSLALSSSLLVVAFKLEPTLLHSQNL